MSNTKENNNKKNDQKALFEEITRRYGRKMACEIVENIKTTLDEGKTPDYMLVKALSELLELFRGEAQTILKQLKAVRESRILEGTNILNLEKRKLELEFRRIYRLYWVSRKLFYPLYERAMADYSDKIDRLGRPPQTTSTAIAA